MILLQQKSIIKKGELIQDMATLQALKRSTDIEEAKKLANSILRRSKSQGYYEASIAACRYFVLYYSHYNFDRRDKERFQKQLDHFLRLEQERQDASDFFYSIKMCFDRSRTITDDIKEKSAGYIDQLKLYASSYDHGPYFYHIYYHTLAIDRNINRDYEGEIAISTEGYEYFREIGGFDTSEFMNLNTLAEGYLCIEDMDNLARVLSMQAEYNVINASVRRQYMICEARYWMIRRKPIDNLIMDFISYKDQDALYELIDMYITLYNGGTLEEKGFERFKKYQDDTTGLGISLNILRLWNAHLLGNIPDHHDRIRDVKRRHGIDQRSLMMFDFFLSGKRPDFSGTAFNQDIEIIPYHVLVDMVLS